MRYAYAANRDIGLWVLEYMMGHDARPSALLITGVGDHDADLVATAQLPADAVYRGRPSEMPHLAADLRALDLDYIICVHYPYIIKRDLLDAPRLGVLNLHPALLPYNRGWHTPSWAILDGTPAGATLHYMTEVVDAGDIIAQQALDVRPEDTAHSLYQRLKQLELQVFCEAFPALSAGTPERTPQASNGTSHRRDELARRPEARLVLEQQYRLADLLRSLRGQTTNMPEEACYYELDGVRYHVQVQITARGE